ncbi:HutD family protein [Pseudorhodobacter turbinis]|uniref:HutD family protein n=1 Tax=Pseudorhodobacter turbinis TaxID=2500533 RepID=A0A4P8EGV9_9RHOB|nr:HutD family protein [Pseudorhodobacter turbinis]QCO56097.1 HutD family protein [Pseudorhodobacter turbinis]
MTRHLTRADYTEMPWANGQGTTIEIWREADESGLRWRFSMATVAKDGPFSQFPDIERNLTVIDGPGFNLVGDSHFRAGFLKPVAFPGDVPLSAQDVSEAAVDFNVMTHRSLPKPVVEVFENTTLTPCPDATLCLFALGAVQYGDITLARHDFLIGAPAAILHGAPVLAIQLFEQPQ